MEYNKPWKSYEEQLDLLISRGLTAAICGRAGVVLANGSMTTQTSGEGPCSSWLSPRIWRLWPKRCRSANWRWSVATEHMVGDFKVDIPSTDVDDLSIAKQLIYPVMISATAVGCKQDGS